MSRVLLLVLIAALAFLPAAARAATSDVVVSQIYGGGGNAGATFRNDYVELFHAGSAGVDVSGWTVQYATAMGVLDAVRSGDIPRDKADELGVIVSVWLNPSVRPVCVVEAKGLPLSVRITSGRP